VAAHKRADDFDCCGLFGRGVVGDVLQCVDRADTAFGGAARTVRAELLYRPDEAIIELSLLCHNDLILRGFDRHSCVSDSSERGGRRDQRRDRSGQCRDLCGLPSGAPAALAGCGGPSDTQTTMDRNRAHVC